MNVVHTCMETNKMHLFCLSHPINCHSCAELHRCMLNLHRCALIAHLWRFSMHLWRLSMHERCTYMYGDEQRASILPVTTMNGHSCVLNLHRCMLNIHRCTRSAHIYVNLVCMNVVLTYVYGDEQRASVLPMSHRKTACTV